MVAATSARLDATTALLVAAGLLYEFRNVMRKQVLASAGVEDGYSLRDAAFALGLADTQLADLIYPADREHHKE